MGKKNKGASTSILGKFRDEAIGEAKNIAKDTGKQLAGIPKGIFKDIMGEPNQDAGEGGSIENLTSAGSGDPAQVQAQAQQLLMKKKMDEKERTQKLLKLHRDKMQEEVQFIEQLRQETKRDEQVEEQKKKQKKQEKVVQLQRERKKESQLQGKVRGKQGSKEFGRKKY